MDSGKNFVGSGRTLTVFTAAEEEKLVDHIKKCLLVGCGMSHHELAELGKGSHIDKVIFHTKYSLKMPKYL